MASLLSRLSFVFLPGTCILCGAPTRRNKDICAGCEGDLPRITDYCNLCGVPVGVGSTLCERCALVPPTFDACFAPFLYAAPIDYLIARFKQQGQRLVGHILAELLATAWLTEEPQMPDVFLPVPLHKSRLRSRGFNQAEEIAAVLSRATRIPVDNRSCRRVIATPDQKVLSAVDRQQNLRRAFRLERTFTGTHVAIVDDVVTTTATVTEIARLLRAAGAVQISVIALARTPLW